MAPVFLITRAELWQSKPTTPSTPLLSKLRRRPEHLSTCAPHPGILIELSYTKYIQMHITLFTLYTHIQDIANKEPLRCHQR